MSIQEVLDGLKRDGFTVSLTDSGDLKVAPRPAQSALDALSAHKSEVVAYLRRPITPTEITDTCLDLMRSMPDHVTEKLDSLLSAAMASDWREDDQIRLTLAMTEAYARWANTRYRAAIWGGKTWAEAFGSKLAPIQRSNTEVSV